MCVCVYVCVCALCVGMHVYVWMCVFVHAEFGRPKSIFVHVMIEHQLAIVSEIVCTHP